MYDIEFEWDPAKDRSNLRKHGISFEEASLVFYDPLHISLRESVANGEQRWQTLGRVEGHHLLLIAHTTWEKNQAGMEVQIVRIISARRAEPKERRLYEKQDG